MVAPSLLMVAFPRSSTINLSAPRGPSVVATVLTTLKQALMLLSSWPRPWLWSVPSRSYISIDASQCLEIML